MEKCRLALPPKRSPAFLSTVASSTTDPSAKAALKRERLALKASARKFVDQVDLKTLNEHLRWVYGIGLLAVGVLLVWEHRLVRPDDLSRVNAGTIDAVLRFTATMLPYPSMIGFQQLHGAGARVPAGATAFPHRYDHHVVWISPVEEDAALDEAMIRWTHECWEALRPHADRAVYVNALGDGAVEGEARVREAYGANYPRLKALKQVMDPTNFFRQNSNIQPHTTPKS